MRARVGAALQFAGKAQVAVVLVEKDVLPAGARERFPVPRFVFHLRAAEHAAHIRNRVLGAEQAADGQLGIDVEVCRKRVVQKPGFGVQVIGDAVAQLDACVEIGELVLTDRPAQKRAELFRCV